MFKTLTKITTGILFISLTAGCQNEGQYKDYSLSGDKVKLDQISSLVEGFDINGNLKSCKPLQNLACSKILLPDDIFAAECEQAGNEAIQCGCHSYLCREKPEAEMEPETNGKIPKLTPSQSSKKNKLDKTMTDGVKVTGFTLVGFDINGLKSKCEKQVVQKCPKIPTPGHRFAAECEDQGYESFKCDCYNYLCSEAIEFEQGN